MSKSKHVRQDVPPMPRRHILRNESGNLRPGWVLAGRAALWLTVTVAVRLGLGALLRALFGAWNLNAETVARAPGWARVLYAWQGSAVTLLVDVAAIWIATSVCRARLPRPDRRALAVWGAGTGVALGSAALFLLTDSLRPAWPLSSPRLDIGLVFLCGLSLLTALAEELFTKGVIYDGIRPHWGGAWAAGAAALVFFLMNGGYSGSWISGVNVALMGLLCALLYARFGLWATVALRWGWGFATVFLWGRVYRLYGVSETLLTGGDAGLVYGLWLTAVLVILNIIILRRSR